MALDSAFVAVVFVVEPAEAGSGSVVEPAEAGSGSVVGLAEAGSVVGPAEAGLGSVVLGIAVLAVLVLDTVAVPGTVVAEPDQDNVAEVVELEVDRVVVVVIDPVGIVAHGRPSVVAVIPDVAAKDAPVADDTGTRIVVGTVLGTAKQYKRMC